MRKSTNGFTIVELLIVIVVIAILAAITIVAYNGMQVRARDTVRSSDIEVIAKALDMYYAEHGQYPQITATAPGMGVGGAISSEPFKATWDQFESLLGPYVSKLPKDPINSPLGNRYEYRSYANNSDWPILCPTSAPYQSYTLIYRPEKSTPTHEIRGNCKNNVKPWQPASDTQSIIVRVQP